MTQLHTFASFTIQPEKSAIARQVMDDLRTNTRNLEPGCLSYIFLQSTEDATHFTTSEIWESAEAEAAHWTMPHLQAALARLPEFIATPPVIAKFTPI